jgi:putative PIN family toxin of toxin-antitoxin system
MRNVVIDTNVLVSAYLGGRLETIIVAWIAGKFVLTVSDQIVSEYINVLSRPKFKILRVELDDFAALILSKAEFVSPEESIRVIEADPSDNKFLEAAVAGKVDYIVSGDKHLRDLKEFRGIAVQTPSVFLERLKEL